MMKLAMMIGAAMLAGPAVSLAGDKSDFGAKPTSFVPHPHTNHHVYGAPIGRAIVGHTRSARHKHTPKRPI